MINIKYVKEISPLDASEMLWRLERIFEYRCSWHGDAVHANDLQLFKALNRFIMKCVGLKVSGYKMALRFCHVSEHEWIQIVSKYTFHSFMIMCLTAWVKHRYYWEAWLCISWGYMHAVLWIMCTVYQSINKQTKKQIGCNYISLKFVLEYSNAHTVGD